MGRTVFRTCTLCEAMCGLKFDVDGQDIVFVGPDEEDVFSRGYICPKGAAIADVHNDPDRLRTPLRRTARGSFEPISWPEAFDIVGARLRTIRKKFGPDAIAFYAGNPIGHNHGVLTLRNGFFRALGTKNCTSAGSQDTSPRFAASYYLYGSSLAIPVPDIERTDYLLCLGANPRVSNGSFLTAPNIRERLLALRRRGGKLVVVDPRKTETARDADEHVSILPGGDAPLLLAMCQVIVAEGLARRADIDRLANGWPKLESRLSHFTPEQVEDFVGIPASVIRRLAREFSQARTAAAYSRVGVCNNEHGTIATMATDLLNLVAGRLGAVGGSMFPTPVFDAKPILKLTNADGHARWRSRLRNLPETLGDLPAAILAEEIETPGTGQIRAMITYAGNPVLSTPNGRRLDQALEQLDFMVAVDLYVNETTRHADIILPPAWGLCDDHVDIVMSNVAVRNIARWSPPALEKPAGSLADWEILLEIAYRLGGGPTGIRPIDAFYRWGRHFGVRWKPDSTIDLLVRMGPYGDRFLPWRKGLNLKKLKAAPHGIDLGPMQPGIAHRVWHADGRMQLDVPVLLAAIDDLADKLQSASRKEGELLLIGRRDLRSNNSWMHNIPKLVSGKARCALLVHPMDAERLGIEDGGEAVLENQIHRATVPVQWSTDMRPGVVSLPHGWGHQAAAPWQQVAGAHPGISANNWTDDQWLETVVGQSILNGVPVQLRKRLPTDELDILPADSATRTTA
ncbi:MAG: molybdopterin-dependent oxidoreductase [Planctomycetota bacterium]